jgi:hypothetical protein
MQEPAWHNVDGLLKHQFGGRVEDGRARVRRQGAGMLDPMGSTGLRS